jgi:arsenite methyltransferase
MIESDLRRHRGDYGIDAPLTGLLPPAALGLGFTAFGAYHIWRGNTTAARIAVACGLPGLVPAGLYLHATRRGKFVVWAEILESLHLRGDERALDVGCGRGAITAMVAKLTPRGHVTGLDLWRSQDQSGNTPAVAEANLDAEGVLDRCELKTGDMLDMPFPDGSFDLVVSNLAIHNVDERDVWHHDRRLLAINEIVRVLRPGGRLAIADLLWTGRYAQRLRDLGMQDVAHRRLGWRMWYAPGLGADLLLARKAV